jgi:hypothetical protein
MEKEAKKIMEKKKNEIIEISIIENIRMGQISALGSEYTHRIGDKMTLNDQYTKINR